MSYDESAAQQLGRLLAEHRRAGLTFFAAWPRAMSAIRFSSIREQTSWLRVWEDVQVFSAWMAAYDRQPHNGSLSVAQLAGLHEEVAYSDSQAVEPFIAHRAGQ
jgi:hypothetical protein